MIGFFLSPLHNVSCSNTTHPFHSSQLVRLKQRVWHISIVISSIFRHTHTQTQKHTTSQPFIDHWICCWQTLVTNKSMAYRFIDNDVRHKLSNPIAFHQCVLYGTSVARIQRNIATNSLFFPSHNRTDVHRAYSASVCGKSSFLCANWEQQKNYCVSRFFFAAVIYIRTLDYNAFFCVCNVWCVYSANIFLIICI